jgi:hypothetical protein
LRHHPLTPDSLKSLSAAILTTAVEDWKTLDYGKSKYGKIVNGETVDRDEMLEFFFSDDFKNLVRTATNYTPVQIRRALKIPQKTYEEAKAEFDCYQ